MRTLACYNTHAQLISLSIMKGFFMQAIKYSTITRTVASFGIALSTVCLMTSAHAGAIED